MTDGVALTEAILSEIAPLVVGQPSGLVIEAMGAAMMAAVTLGCATAEGRRTVLRRYAKRIEVFANQLDPR
jgi:hypothetical protein